MTIVKSRNLLNDRPEDRRANCVSLRSKPVVSVAAPSAKPPKNSAMTGSAAQESTLGSVYFGSIGARARGINAQSNSVGTNGGTISVIQRSRQIPVIDIIRQYITVSINSGGTIINSTAAIANAAQRLI